MAETIDRVEDETTSARDARMALGAATLSWLAELPEGLRPAELPVRFPRIANELARRWINGAALRAYLEDVLIDKRCTRRGLPPAVAAELAALKNYIETVLYPAPQTAWDEVADRRSIR